jgi:hypothetical protein
MKPSIVTCRRCTNLQRVHRCKTAQCKARAICRASHQSCDTLKAVLLGNMQGRGSLHGVRQEWELAQGAPR